jgi:hypothetical protein
MQGRRRPLPRLMPKCCTTTHRSLPPQSCCLLLLLQTMQSAGKSYHRVTVRWCLFYSLYSRRRQLLMPPTLPRSAIARRRSAQRQSESSSSSQAGTRARWKFVDAILRTPCVSRAFPNNKMAPAVVRCTGPFLVFIFRATTRAERPQQEAPVWLPLYRPPPAYIR